MTEKKKTLREGDTVTINRYGDIWMDGDLRPFISYYNPPLILCTYIKRTKSGLVEVHLKDNPKMRASFPLRNVDLYAEESTFNSVDDVQSTHVDEKQNQKGTSGES